MTTLAAVDVTTSTEMLAIDSTTRAAAMTSTMTLASDTVEVVTLSEQISCALECPICLNLMSVMSCFCPNGHALCQPCMLMLLNTRGTSNTDVQCPLCRTLMVHLSSSSAMIVKLSQLSAFVKVACPHQSFGCPELVPVQLFNEHQSMCRYVPDVPCQVAVCQWVGAYEQLYEHVHNVHPGIALQTPGNRLKVTDIQEILKNRRRTYLIQSTYGMFWVLLSRNTRSQIYIGLFMVDNTWSRRHSTSTHDRNCVNPWPPDIVYRVTWFDCNGRNRTRSRTNVAKWSTILKEGGPTVFTDAYSTFRFNGGSLEINWFPSLRYYFNYRTNPWI